MFTTMLKTFPLERTHTRIAASEQSNVTMSLYMLPREQASACHCLVQAYLGARYSVASARSLRRLWKRLCFRKLKQERAGSHSVRNRPRTTYSTKVIRRMGESSSGPLPISNRGDMRRRNIKRRNT